MTNPLLKKLLLLILFANFSWSCITKADDEPELELQKANESFTVNINSITEEQRTTKEEITFRVQLAATRRKIDPEPKNFKGLQQVERKEEGKFFRYYLGETSNVCQIKELLEEARRKGFKSSYVVAFRENERLGVKLALQMMYK